MSDESLAGDTPGDTPFGNPNGTRTPQIDTILTLDEIMSSARLTERSARICLRGDLTADLNEHLEKLSTLVDADGNMMAEGDAALSAGAEAGDLYEQIKTIRAQMEASMRTVRFRAMPDDEWTTFEKQHKPKGEDADFTGFNNKIIARCAISPTMTEEDVKTLRSKLGLVQITALANAAFWACTTGGLDVPKLPGFSRGPKHQQSGKS